MYNPDGTLNADAILGGIGNWWNKVNAPVNLTAPRNGTPTDWRTAGQLQSNPMNLLGGTIGGAAATTNQPKLGQIPPLLQNQPIVDQPVDNTQEQIAGLLQQILGSGGGGANTSGYKELLKDIQARKTALKKRYKQNKADIKALYEGASTAREADKVALNQAVTKQLEDDIAIQEQRAKTTSLEEASRLGTVNQAREALGAETSKKDLASQVVESGMGRLAESNAAAQADIRTNQSIGQQQLQSEISGYTSAQELANRALGTSYEDALAGLASERASVKAQIAQAMASGGRSNSPSEIMAAMKFAQEQVQGTPTSFTGKTPQNVFDFYTSQGSDPNKLTKIFNTLTGKEGMALWSGNLTPPQIVSQLLNKGAISNDPDSVAFATDILNTLK